MKILVSDFDKTLYREDYLKNIKHVNKFVEEGNIFIIATGRNIKSILGEISNKNIKYDYLICNDGGTIFDKNNNLVISKNIDFNIVEEICKIVKSSDSIDTVYIDNGITLVESISNPTNGIIAGYNDYLKTTKLLSNIMESYPSVHGYLSENWLNITNIEASKGLAIKYLEEKLGWNKDDIFVAGDNINDISMFELYKGFAMADGSKDLKKICYKIVDKYTHIFDLMK